MTPPEQLDREVEITPDDVERAKLAWKQAASPEFRDLLDATPLPDSEQDGEVTPEVEREADVSAQQHGGALFRAMLDAVPERITAKDS